MTEVAAMQDNHNSPFDELEERAQRIVAECMDNGWSVLEIEEMMKRAIEAENTQRRDREAERLYGPAAKSMDAEPSAVAIVAKAKLPRGEYAITRPTEVAPVSKGAAIRAVGAALETGEPCRLYRLADGWRFVGVVHPGGQFVDERKESM